MSRAQAEEERVGEDGDRFQDAVQVEERLAHTHEDDVCQVAPRRGQTPRGVANLIDDLRGLEIPAEAKLTGGAEGAAHGAAGLTGDAERMPLTVQRPAGARIPARRVVHQNGLHERPAGEAVECLLGQTTVGDRDLVLFDRVDPEGRGDGFLKGRGQAAQLGRGGGVVTPDRISYLLGPKCRLTDPLQPLIQRADGEATEAGPA